MNELEPSQLPPRVAAILALREAKSLPLQWHTVPNRAAKIALDGTGNDADLLAPNGLADEAMGAAVRALLYFWAGWPAEASMYIHLAPERERVYLNALRERQAGATTSAKALLQQIDNHPIYPALAQYALEIASAAVAPGLKRLCEVITFAEQWEPFTFCDVFEQAREGQLDPAAERIVCDLQRREFELLLVHCLEGAVGKTLVQRAATAVAERRRPEVARSRRPAKRPAEVKPASAAGPKVLLKPEALRGGVQVLCPKCGTHKSVAEERRGCVEKCDKCGTPFLIPQRRPGAPAAQGSPPAS